MHCLHDWNTLIELTESTISLRPTFGVDYIYVVGISSQGNGGIPVIMVAAVVLQVVVELSLLP